MEKSFSRQFLNANFKGSEKGFLKVFYYNKFMSYSSTSFHPFSYSNKQKTKITQVKVTILQYSIHFHSQ
jgi:hypothetical protein